MFQRQENKIQILSWVLWCCRGVIMWRRKDILGRLKCILLWSLPWVSRTLCFFQICCIIHICSIVLLLRKLQHKCNHWWCLQSSLWSSLYNVLLRNWGGLWNILWISLLSSGLWLWLRLLGYGGLTSPKRRRLDTWSGHLRWKLLHAHNGMMLSQSMDTLHHQV